jgi:hypothetical protein
MAAGRAHELSGLAWLPFCVVALHGGLNFESMLRQAIIKIMRQGQTPTIVEARDLSDQSKLTATLSYAESRFVAGDVTAAAVP